MNFDKTHSFHCIQFVSIFPSRLSDLQTSTSSIRCRETALQRLLNQCLQLCKSNPCNKFIHVGLCMHVWISKGFYFSDRTMTISRSECRGTMQSCSVFAVPGPASSKGAPDSKPHLSFQGILGARPEKATLSSCGSCEK